MGNPFSPKTGCCGGGPQQVSFSLFFSISRMFSCLNSTPPRPLTHQNLSSCFLFLFWDDLFLRRNVLSPRKIPMLSIKPLIKPYILNYYISSVVSVCRIEPFIAPFHYNCTIRLIYIYIYTHTHTPRRPSLRMISSHLVH
jgi:hypothetical protein